MKEEQDYIRDITEMRSMMERSSKFMSVSGWAGIMAGIYALVGAYIAYKVVGFDPGETVDRAREAGSIFSGLLDVIFLATMILVLAAGTAAFLSFKKSIKRGEKIWTATTKRLLINMAVPFIAGAVLILILISKGLISLVAPFTLLFYGLALFNAGKYTYGEVRTLGLVQIVLGLISIYFTEHGLWFWALGFGVVHIIYGVYMIYRHER